MNLNSADYWLHFFVDFFLAPKQQWEKFCDRNIGILLAQQIVTIHVGCWMPILLCFIIALSRAQLQLRELCISTAQALSQPQLHNYCLHERERERDSHGAVLWPPPPLTNQQVKRLMLHWSQWSCQRHHHLRPDRLALATRAVGDSTLSTEGFTDLVGSPLSSHTPQLPPPPPGLCILIRIFLFLFWYKIRACHYLNNLIKQSWDHDTASLPVSERYSKYLQTQTDTDCVEWSPRGRLPPPAIICILPVKYFTQLYVVHTTTTTTTTRSWSQWQAVTSSSLVITNCSAWHLKRAAPSQESWLTSN